MDTETIFREIDFSGKVGRSVNFPERGDNSVTSITDSRVDSRLRRAALWALRGRGVLKFQAPRCNVDPSQLFAPVAFVANDAGDTGAAIRVICQLTSPTTSPIRLVDLSTVRSDPSPSPVFFSSDAHA